MTESHRTDAAATPTAGRRVSEKVQARHAADRRRVVGTILAVAALLAWVFALNLLTADVWDNGTLCGNRLSSANAGAGCEDALYDRLSIVLLTAAFGAVVALYAGLYRLTSAE